MPSSCESTWPRQVLFVIVQSSLFWSQWMSIQDVKGNYILRFIGAYWHSNTYTPHRAISITLHPSDLMHSTLALRNLCAVGGGLKVGVMFISNTLSFTCACRDVEGRAVAKYADAGATPLSVPRNIECRPIPEYAYAFPVREFSLRGRAACWFASVWWYFEFIWELLLFRLVKHTLVFEGMLL